VSWFVLYFQMHTDLNKVRIVSAMQRQVLAKPWRSRYQYCNGLLLIHMGYMHLSLPQQG
jgi:hypothetical protein